VAVFEVLKDAPVRKSDDVLNPRVETQLKAFLGDLLGRCADVLSGARPLTTLPLDEAFLNLWESNLDQPVAQTLAAIDARYLKDIPFTKEMNQWMVRDQGWLVSEKNEEVIRDNMERAAKFSCYVLATKVIFYKALRRRFPAMRELTIGENIEKGDDLRALLVDYFDHATKMSGDYETVFKSDWGERLPFLNDDAVANWRHLSEQTENFDFTTIDYEVIGQIFERMLEPEERHKWGQHYTRSEIVDLINAFCIRQPDDSVLDPACGGGTFLVRAYKRKSDLAGGAARHQDLITQIHGFDISAYPAHLTTINLATRDLVGEANYPLIARSDFFRIMVGEPAFRVPQKTKDAPGVEVMPKVRAIIGNPPYVRQEKINAGYSAPDGSGPTYKDYLRALARVEAPTVELSSRSDLHCYFFSHGLTFLEEGGYMGFLVSSNWLDTGYGFRLQKFLLDNFEIVAIFESNCEPWFTGARVTTAAVILRQQSDARKRNANTVRFVSLTRPLSELFADTPQADGRLTYDALRDKIESLTGDQSFDIHPSGSKPVRVWQTVEPGMRVRVVSQKDLYDLGCVPFTASGVVNVEADEEVAVERDEDETNEEIEVADEDEAEDEAVASDWHDEMHDALSRPASDYIGYKWGIFLRAPDTFFELLRRGGERWVPLGKLANIKRGVTSGCDKFFFPKDVTNERLKQLGADVFEATYGISAKQTGRIRLVQAGDKSAHLVEAKYLEPVAFNLMEIDSVEVNRERLQKQILLVAFLKERLKGTHVAKYVLWGEDEGFDERKTCAARVPWYDLSASERGDIFWTKSQRYRHLAAFNSIGVLCNCNLYYLKSLGEASAEVLAAVLNSTVVALNKHQFGRTMGGDPLLKTEVVDVKMMLVPDPRLASPDVQKRLTDALASLRKRKINHLVDVDGTGDAPSGDLTNADRQQLDDAVLELLGVADPKERQTLRAQLYREVTALFRSIRAAEKRMQAFRNQSARRGKITPRTLAQEIWDTYEVKPQLRTLQEWAQGHEAETITLPRAKALVVDSLFNPKSLSVAGTFIPLEHLDRARFAKALSDSGVSGAVHIPRNAEVCARALNEHEEQQKQLADEFSELAEQRTANEKTAQSIVRELWRLASQGGEAQASGGEGAV